MAVTLQRLRSFIALAEQGGFRKAAESLSVSQPALTSHIKELEDDLGVKLFSRTTRQATLTPEGRLFLARAQRALSELDSAVEDVRQTAAVQRGRILLGSTPSTAYSVVPAVLAKFHKEYPNVKVTLFDDRSEIIEKRLLGFEIDLLIGPAPENARDIDYIHLFDDPFMAVFPPEHELARKPTVAAKELLHHDLIVMRPGLRMRSILEESLAREGLELKPAQEVINQYTLCALVEAGIGVGALPQLIVSTLSRERLRAAKIVSPEITRRIGVMTRHGQPLHPAAQRFIELLQMKTS